MQLQMFVTNLKKCDFLETCFKEYESEEAFYKDGTFLKTETQKAKGIIVCFHDGRKPVYKCPAWGISQEKYDIWYNNLLAEENNLTWTQNVYWYLNNYSCITVPFNDIWMRAAIPYFKDIWETVERERIEGYEHRKPTKRKKKPPIVLPTIPAKTDTAMGTIQPSSSETVILKIRTESFSSVKCNNS